MTHVLRKIDTERDISFENENVRSLNKAQVYRKDSTNSNDHHSIVVVTAQRLKDFSGSDFSFFFFFQFTAGHMIFGFE